MRTASIVMVPQQPLLHSWLTLPENFNQESVICLSGGPNQHGGAGSGMKGRGYDFNGGGGNNTGRAGRKPSFLFQSFLGTTLSPAWRSPDESPNPSTCSQLSHCFFLMNVTPVSLPASWLEEGYLQRFAEPPKPPSRGRSNVGTALGHGP